MSQIDHHKLDFDRLLNLAEKDPARFEDMRQEAIDAYIATLPADRQVRMRRLQWRIDQERRNRSPMSACMRISSMMWEHIVGPRGMLGYLHGDWAAAASTRRGKGCVIEFPAEPSGDPYLP
ncbi:MAG: DUF3135 domain-containing protein [Candidatus Thiodiazotropha sp. (ex Dulcina madagascariensis)]|nr:DUF3135 domain-containing protein [Candidatus Thiodiazotropha sp. (ex Dulcina madagascariensis)]MCU7925637.1 DUF3135 domain-containing protein [Candidatus Thiodiazotropha sp. (ex Dulcina madagascariensis)]